MIGELSPNRESQQNNLGMFIPALESDLMYRPNLQTIPQLRSGLGCPNCGYCKECGRSNGTYPSQSICTTTAQC